MTDGTTVLTAERIVLIRNLANGLLDLPHVGASALERERYLQNARALAETYMPALLAALEAAQEALVKAEGERDEALARRNDALASLSAMTLKRDALATERDAGVLERANLAARVAELRARLGALASEVCGAPELDPHNRDDQRWCPALEEARMLRERVVALEGALHRDKTGLGAALAEIAKVVKGYGWIVRGEWASYSYEARTAETMRAEATWALEAVDKLAADALGASGALAQQMLCPPAAPPEQASTSDDKLRARVAELEGALASARAALERLANQYEQEHEPWERPAWLTANLPPAAPPEQAPRTDAWAQPSVHGLVDALLDIRGWSAPRAPPNWATTPIPCEDLRARIYERTWAALPGEPSVFCSVAPQTVDGARARALQEAISVVKALREPHNTQMRAIEALEKLARPADVGAAPPASTGTAADLARLADMAAEEARKLAQAGDPLCAWEGCGHPLSEHRDGVCWHWMHDRPRLSGSYCRCPGFVAPGEVKP